MTPDAKDGAPVGAVPQVVALPSTTDAGKATTDGAAMCGTDVAADEFTAGVLDARAVALMARPRLLVTLEHPEATVSELAEVVDDHYLGQTFLAIAEYLGSTARKARAEQTGTRRSPRPDFNFEGEMRCLAQLAAEVVELHHIGHVDGHMLDQLAKAATAVAVAAPAWTFEERPS